MTHPWILYPLLLAVGAVAGWVDSIAGGGGLVTIPVLLATGIPPQMVLGTNKFQASFGSFTAALHYARNGVVPTADIRLGVVCTLVGAALGAAAVQRISGDILASVIPVLLLATAIYMWFAPSVGERDNPAKMPRTLFYALFGIGLGFYDGFFGPGVGSFWAVAFVAFLGFGLTKATGYTKVMNFTSNIVSLFLFLLGGHVLYAAGLAMALGQVLGARLGASLVLRRGARFVRPVFIAVVVITTTKLLYDRLMQVP